MPPPPPPRARRPPRTCHLSIRPCCCAANRCHRWDWWYVMWGWWNWCDVDSLYRDLIFFWLHPIPTLLHPIPTSSHVQSNPPPLSPRAHPEPKSFRGQKKESKGHLDLDKRKVATEDKRRSVMIPSSEPRMTWAVDGVEGEGVEWTIGIGGCWRDDCWLLICFVYCDLYYYERWSFIDWFYSCCCCLSCLFDSAWNSTVSLLSQEHWTAD
jgi:hypothetical protein